MKKLTLITSLILLSLNLALGQVTPLECNDNRENKTTRNFVPIDQNFIIQDVNTGTVHDLQAYLDDGQYVIVDLSATWCSNCWGLHQSGVLDSLHNKYGPPGTDELVVIWGEIDGSTTIDDIEGNTGGTQGDYTNGGNFPVPIINDASIQHSFDSLFNGGVPRVFLVCPSGDYKNVTNEAWSSADDVYAELSTCPVTLNANFEASDTTITEGDCIYFQDQSTGNVDSWNWTFDGANTGNSTTQNPNNICYDTAGTYDVTLVIENASGQQDSVTYTDYITVNDSSMLPGAYFTSDKKVVQEGGVVNFEDTSKNAVFVSWDWSFEGGMPSTSTDSQPNPVAYLDVGTYDVELTVEDQNGNQYTNLKEDYIIVVPEATEPPVADFIANYTVISPGETVDFHDLSSNTPIGWKWTFESGQPNNVDNQQHPSGILYSAEGKFDVKLIVQNSEGTDTIVKKDYIVVSIDDPCSDTTMTEAKFTASNRLISAGEKVYFQDQSKNYPSSWNWTFEGGSPVSSSMGSPVNGIKYNDPGIYNVSLNVSNECGSDQLMKKDYIYVFSGTIPKYCDTITNIKSSENTGKINVGQWGSIAGHNSERVRYYADYFKNYSFSQIEGLVVPVIKSVYANNSSYVWFYIWAGNTDTPNQDSIIAEKRVYLKNLPENYSSVIEFDDPVNIDGPFYAGFKINYPDNNSDGMSDDRFIISVGPDRGTQTSKNTMYVYKGGEWKTSVEVFDIATSTAIKPIACLVDIDEIEMEKNVNVYPNPTSGDITLKLGDEYRSSNIDIRVYDFTGRVISMDKKQYGKTEYNFDFSDKAAGMYYMNIFIDGEKVSKKISVVK